MAEIYLVRHGQASFNSDNYDCLSDLGWQQSEYLGQYFQDRNITFDQFFTGTQTRHKQTAKGILNGSPALSGQIHAGLNEYDFKALYAAYMAQHPEEEDAPKDGDRRIFYRRLKLTLTLWSQDKLQNELYGEIPESWQDFHNRTQDVLNHISSTGQSSLVVSSGGAISMIIGHILGLSPDHVINLNLQIKNASFCHIRIDHNSLHLFSFNNIPHLDHPDRLDAITYS